MTADQKSCMNSIEVDTSNCYYKCTGMDIISYDKFEPNPQVKG